MATSARALDGVLRAIAGAEGVATDGAALAAAAVDGLLPRAVVRAAAVEHVAQVLALASEDGLVVVPRGAGRALDLGVPPARVDVVLDVGGLARIVEFNPDDLTVTVETGVTLGVLSARLLPRGQWLPLDPAGGGARTLGGLAATNASGPLRARYGTLRDLLLGVRFVQADGVVTWGGARVVKSVTGYDVPKLMVGALGTLGVLTEMTLRLHPVPDTERTWAATFASVERLQAALDGLLDSPIQPTRVEVLDAGAARALAGTEAAGALLLSIGSVAEAVREQGQHATGLLRAAGGTVAERAAAVWSEHDRLATAGAGETALLVATLPAQIDATLHALAQGAAAGGLDVRATGRGSIGAVDAVVGAGAPAARVASFVGRLRDALGAFGGTVVVRGGPREVRTAVDPWGPVPADTLAIMRRIKDEFDPRRVLNAGRFVGGL